MGLDTDKTVFYRQSDVPQVTELTWYLDCFFSFQRLQLAHAFKDKADRLSDVNAGLSTILSSWLPTFCSTTPIWCR